MFISFSFYFLLCYSLLLSLLFFFFFNDTATTEIYTLSLHDALPISGSGPPPSARRWSPRGSRTTSCDSAARRPRPRSEEHTSELQSPCNLVCRLLLEKKKKKNKRTCHENKKTPCQYKCIIRAKPQCS